MQPPVQEAPAAYQPPLPPVGETVPQIPVPLVRTVQKVPQAKYSGVDLKKYASFKHTRASVKLKNQEALAVQQLDAWLGNIDKEANQFNLELIADIASFCQSFFIYGSAEERKQSIDTVQTEVLLPYAQGDRAVLAALLESVDHRIVRSTKFSRRLRKICNSFFFVVEKIQIRWSSSAKV